MARELSFDAYQQRRHMPALDGLRAIAILGVLLHHTRHQPFHALHGYRGVWVFFVLSGFLITTLALREETRAGRLDIRAFMVRRAFRILPLYYLALGAYLVWVLALGMEPHAARFQSHLLNYLFYTPELPIFEYRFQIPFGQTWSLGIEEKFYLLWPVLAFGLLARSRHRLPVTLGLLAVTGLFTASEGWLGQMWASYMDILIGCVVAQLMHRRATYERLAVLGRTPVAWAVVIAFGLSALASGTGLRLPDRLFSVLAAVALIALVTNRRGPATLMSSPVLVRLGVWSYAIYLTHTIVFEIVNPWMPAGRVGDCLTLLAMLAIDVPLCWLLHIWIEKPLIRLGRRLAARQPLPAAVAPALLDVRDRAG